MSLFTKELWELRYRFISMAVIIIGLGIFVLGSYKFFVAAIDLNEIALVFKNSLISNYFNPEIVLNQIISLKKDISFYVWSQWFGKNFLQLILLGVILLGFPTFARENENNTNSFLLSNFTRHEVFTSKVYAGLISVLLLIAIGCFLPIMVSIFAGFNFSLILAIKYFMQILPVSLFLYSLIILFSILAKDVIKPVIYGVITFVLLSLFNKFALLKQINVYRYLSAVDVFTHNQVNFFALIIFPLLTIGVFLLAYRVYVRTDF